VDRKIQPEAAQRLKTARSARRVIGNLIVAGFVLAGIARIWPWSKDHSTTESPNQRGDKESRPLEVEPRWFEDKRAIYHDIPARVMFHLGSGEPTRAAEIARRAWAEFNRVGVIFNAFDPNSEVGRLNRGKGGECRPVSRDLAEVIRLSQELWRKSEGRFDPTLWPLKELWRAAAASQRAPGDDAIAEVLSHVGLAKVQWCKEPDSIRLMDPEISFDFGGIAKGYAVDRVGAVLRAEGIRDGLVQLGGEIACFGQAPAGAWRLGIQHPKDMSGLWGSLTRQGDIRVSTSGNYRQPLTLDSKTYYHIFDPTTGRPASNLILGVTTVGLGGRVNSAMLDGAATAITVLGAEKGIKLAASLGIEALVLVDDGQGGIAERATAGFPPIFSRDKGAK